MSDNEIIEVFMGLKRRDVRNGGFPVTMCYPSNDWDNFFSPPEYERDWNALMPVVDKIATLYDHEPDYLDEYQNVVTISIITSISDVHKAVVEFIHWYNKQKAAV